MYYLYYVCLLRFVFDVNIETFLHTCVRRKRIIKVKVYSLHLKESNNDKLKKQGQVPAFYEAEKCIDRR